MSSTALTETNLRDRIISDPGVILEDRDLMRVLVSANEKSMGSNVVDLRGIAMDRLEARLERLEDTHRSVIAAAYENLAGTNQIHKAVLALLDPHEFTDFLAYLNGPVAEILRVDRVRLVLETLQDGNSNAVRKLGEALAVAEPGYVERFIGGSTGRPVTLRQMQRGDDFVYGDRAEWVRSEALLRLDFGEGRLPGMLVLGAEDPHQFAPSQGTDLLSFFGGVFERAMRRWLS
ncbi:recombinase XerC [Actibacterium mucosum KCTC 23349]|uniref:Recombinase XerC n=1 Tax=Actibacterium mucosum KCTC 23349 TaxID=1454373 RepID=A0A037ZH22_9RHOB|nr:DUF484 family protein [Actibacterium mucosum]KAJ54120.1 recombinase XerC [Actibacterium mucosum KCTC 23349]